MNSLEPYVEYHGFAILKNAIDSHAAGNKVQFRLRDEDDLETFKGITKRRKGHAGQIYRMNYRPLSDSEFRVTDVFFLGVSWSHTNGTVVAFEYSDSECWKEFREWPAIMSGKDMEIDPQEVEIVLFKVGDNGELINLAQRNRIEAINKMKGGPQSIRAARLCTDAEFMDYLMESSLVESSSPEMAEKYIKKTCVIKSRKELDNDDVALERFNTFIMSPFNRWRA